MGLTIAWSRVGPQTVVFYAQFPLAEFFRGRVPAADTAVTRELHFWRNGCCYYIPWGTTAAWETYEGRWRFGAVPDDGGQAELGVPAVLRLSGPRTDAPAAAAADFTVGTTTGDSIVDTRWWYVRPSHNAFDGEPLPLVPTGVQFPPLFPRYPDAARSLFSEIATCAGRTTCAYQAAEPGALVVQATLADGRVLAARNTGRSGAHVQITVDSTTLAQGDTTVFRVSAPGANRLTVTGYQFVPVAAGSSSAVAAVHETMALRASRTPVTRNTRATSGSPRSSVRQDTPAVPKEGATAVPVRKRLPFRDAALECGDVTVTVCYDDPPRTGYEVVMAVVDGEDQRDSVLVTVVPGLEVSCTPVAIVRESVVTCTATMSDSSVFIPTHRYSAANGDKLVDEDLSPDSAVSSYTWNGKAILATMVEISALHGHDTVRGRGSFTVIPRTGTEWTGLRIPATPPEPEFVSGDPLAEDPFQRAGSLWAEDGFIGQYLRVEQVGFWGLVVDGPDANLVYTRKPLTAAPPRIFVHAWLQRESVFYKRQHGNSNVIGVGPCSGSDIDRLRNNVIEHEVRHHSADVAFFALHDVRQLLEATTARFDVRQLDDAVKLEAVQHAAYETAFGSAWTTDVRTSVDHDHSIDTPSCRRQ